MKIGIADNLNLKFDRPLKEYWEKSHEVRFELGANPEILEWADVYYVNVWDHNIHAMWSWVEDQKRCKKKAKVICRALDWEVWVGMARSPEIANFVDEIIAIAPHIKRKLEDENPAMKDRVRLIRPGIDLDKFTLKENTGGHKVVMPANDIDWWMKGTLDGLKIFKMLVDRTDLPWTLNIKGIWTKGEVDRLTINDYIEKAGIKDRVKFDTDFVDDYNQYLDQFDYCLKPSYKEAFSYVTAECAAKGIKPILNWWLGAEEMWPQEWLYLSHEKAVNDFTAPDPYKYRRYVEEHYDIKRMFAEYDELLST